MPPPARGRYRLAIQAGLPEFVAWALIYQSTLHKVGRVGLEPTTGGL